jgi:hypothetical protein
MSEANETPEQFASRIWGTCVKPTEDAYWFDHLKATALIRARDERLQQQLEEAVKERKQLRKALSEYAEPTNWACSASASHDSDECVSDSPKCCWDTFIYEEPGWKIAAQARTTPKAGE